MLSHSQTSAVTVHAWIVFVVIFHSRFAAAFENFPQSSIVWQYDRHTIEPHSQMVFDCAVILHIFDRVHKFYSGFIV